MMQMIRRRRKNAAETRHFGSKEKISWQN